MQFCNTASEREQCQIKFEHSRACMPYLFLSVSFCPIMSFAQHLAVTDIGCTAFAPGRYVVGIHVLQVPNLGMVGIVANGA